MKAGGEGRGGGVVAVGGRLSGCNGGGFTWIC